MIKEIKIVVFIYFLLMISPLKSQDFSVIQMPFNSDYYDEFSPVYYEDGLVFCSNRRSSFFVDYTNDKDNKPTFNIFYVEQISKTDWGKVNIFEKKFKSNFNEGPATFNDRQNVIYFTRNLNYKKQFGSSIDRKNRLGIFYSKLTKSDGWQDVQEFKYNNPEYNVAHPSLSEDGKYLFFSSDKPGGFGGSDIYFCELENGDWGEPQNIGNMINTEGNEAFPFVHSSGRLYFSSDRHGSIGRLDIFYTEKVDDEWHKPISLETPINSRFNDYAFIIDPFKKSGYFSSDRQRNEDIYSFVGLYPIFENTKRMEKNDYCYVFYEASAENPDVTSYDYEWDFGDGSKTRGLEVDHCFAGPGDYTVLLNVIDRLTGEVYFNEATYPFKIEDIEQVYINCPDTVFVGQEVVFDGRKSNLKKFDIKSYSWDMGDGRRAKGIEVTHIYTSPGEYIVQLGVTSKTDKQGNSEKQGVFTNIVVLQSAKDKRKRD